MADPTIADYMKYADLQMAAEALYDFDAKKDAANLTPGERISDKPIDEKWLKTGNEHASKFTATDAKKFAAEWTVVDHISNTATGFSGTLFMNKDDGKYYMSIRSTEFIDDEVRDCAATNSLEIFDHGFAFGQIADMENWYQSLLSSGKLPADQKISVTGYSLGGHLATAFNMMHGGAKATDGSDLIERVVTFNGAGVGKIKSGSDSLSRIISDFDDLRKNKDGDAFVFQNQAVSDLYATLRARIKNGTPPDSSDYAALDELETMNAATGGDAQTGKDIARIRDAMKRIDKIEEDRKMVRDVTDSKVGAPAQIPASQIEQMNLDYQMAVLTVAERTESKGLPLNAYNAVTGRSHDDGVTYANQYDVVGTETTSPPWGAVSNSQWHHGQDVPVFIEDQPNWRGTFTKDAAHKIWDYKGVKLLVNNYTDNDFADTHSLVLIADSLRVQELLAKIDPSANQITLSGIFTLASGRKKNEASGTQGDAEGDALENILNALGDMLLGKDKFTRLKGNPNGNTWAKIKDKNDTDKTYTDREDLAKLAQQIATVLGDDDHKNMLGSTKVAASSADLKDSARTDFGSFLALYTLSPFVLKGDYVETPLKANWSEVFKAWTADKDLSAEERAAGKATYSDQWLADRGELMRYWLEAHSENTTNNVGARLAKVSRGGTAQWPQQEHAAASIHIVRHIASACSGEYPAAPPSESHLAPENGTMNRRAGSGTTKVSRGGMKYHAWGTAPNESWRKAA